MSNMSKLIIEQNQVRHSQSIYNAIPDTDTVHLPKLDTSPKTCEVCMIISDNITNLKNSL